MDFLGERGGGVRRLNIVTRVLLSAGGRQERQSQTCEGQAEVRAMGFRALMMEEGHEPRSVGGPVEAGKGKALDSPLKPPEKNAALPLILAQ